MIRLADAGRGALGAVALAAPGALVTGAGSVDRSRLRWVARILGARYVAQAAVGTAVPRPSVWRVDASVDLLHALSMLVAARRWPQHRGIALASAVAATTFAGLDLRDLGATS